MSTYQGRHGKYRGRHTKQIVYRAQHKTQPNRKAIAIKSLSLPAVVVAMGMATVMPTSTALEPTNQTEQINLALAARQGEQASRDANRPLVAPTPASPLKNEVGVQGVKAVKKPEPPPPPPAPEPVAAPSPAALPAASYTSASCQIGVVANAAAMCEAVYANFPVNSIGGLRPGDPQDHGTGHAIDIMVGAYNPLGDTIADWAIANAGTYNVKYIIWRQRTWMPGSGWGGLMGDRGSLTANHYDHVHVSFY